MRNKSIIGTDLFTNNRKMTKMYWIKNMLKIVEIVGINKTHMLCHLRSKLVMLLTLFTCACHVMPARAWNDEILCERNTFQQSYTNLCSALDN